MSQSLVLQSGSRSRVTACLHVSLAARVRVRAQSHTAIQSRAGSVLLYASFCTRRRASASATQVRPGIQRARPSPPLHTIVAGLPVTLIDKERVTLSIRNQIHQNSVTHHDIMMS
jgi:hypothetical protein